MATVAMEEVEFCYTKENKNLLKRIEFESSSDVCKKKNMEEEDDFAKPEICERRIKTFKDAVQYAMLDTRSQKLVENFAKKREVVPDV